MHVELPDALDSVGIVDTGNEQAEVEETDDGVRYVDVDDEDAERVAGAWEDRYDGYDATLIDESDDGAEADGDYDHMTRDELRGMYENLGGKEADPEGDDVNLNVNDEIVAGIERIRGE